MTQVSYKRHRFPAAVIQPAVWLCLGEGGRLSEVPRFAWESSCVGYPDSPVAAYLTEAQITSVR